MRKALLALAVAGIAVMAPAASGAPASVKGVVISRMPARGELVLAGANGRATTLRTPMLPAVGTVIDAAAFKLSDGTSAAAHLTVVGHARHARFSGVLVRTAGGSSFFAVGHSVVVVQTASRSLSSARSSSPLAPGDAAEIEVTITAGGALDEDSIDREPLRDAAEVSLQVTIATVTPATPTTAGSLTLTVNGQPLVIPLPAGTILPAAFVANAVVGLRIEFRDAAAANDNDNEGRDDNRGGVTTTTTTTIPATPGGATTTTTNAQPRNDGDGGRGHDGGGSGRDGGGRDGGGSGRDGGGDG